MGAATAPTSATTSAPTSVPTSAPWSGQWVSDRFGIGLVDRAGPVPVRELVGLALRRNPRRAHLLVSGVLGKHVPADPRLVRDTGLQLGALVADRAPDCALVLGYAETATGLGHLVAQALGADYLHSTRRSVAEVAAAGGFEEEHSHATSHLLLPEDARLLRRPGVLVLVDDELSTGRTALNTIAGLHADYPRERYVIAALIDVRRAEDVAAMNATAAALGTRIDAVALARAELTVPERFRADAARFVAEHGAGEPPAPARAPARVGRASGWPAAARDGGRHGFGVADDAAAHAAAEGCAARLAGQLLGQRVLVLGFEELMYAPLLIACALADRAPAATVRFSSTTRSPVLALDVPGYPIRTQLAFGSHDHPADGPGRRYAYNVAPVAGGQRLSDIVLVLDDAADTPELNAADGLLARLADCAERVHLLVLPSYRPARLLAGAP